MKVVVYAEGGLDLRGALPLDTPPAERLPTSQQGVVHLIVQRMLLANGVAADFVSPLRPGAASMLGSRLLHRNSLKKALAWSPAQSPDLAVVFVDQDGKTDRRRYLAAILEERRRAGILRPTAVIALSVQEIEAWLLADIKSVSGAVGMTIPQPKTLERMKPSAAKGVLQSHVGAAKLEEHVVRRRIAETMDFEVVRKACPSFDTFASEFQAAVGAARPTSS
jgi:hypothetical protein